LSILRGVITALLTPFDKREEILEESLRRIVEFQIQRGVSGFLVCGTAGQGPLMTLAQRKRALEIVVDQAKERAPVIAQVGLPDTQSTIELARHAQDHDATAVACVTPYYYKLDRIGIIGHYEAIASSISIPVFVYNIPRLTGFNVDVTMLKQLASVKGVVGIKDSSRDLTQLIEFRSSLPTDFDVINGTDSLVLSTLLFGLEAAISASANAFPELFVELFSFYQQGRIAEAVERQNLITSLRTIIGEPPVASVHEALKMRGIDSGSVKRPMRELTSEEKARLRGALEQFGLLKRNQ